MSPRAYNSPSRIVASTKTRQRIVAAAAAILGTAEGISGFSLQAVAAKAGVTRLTVYNRFGSRRALLEAVFDDMAVRGGLHRIPGVMAAPDPLTCLCRGDDATGAVVGARAHVIPMPQSDIHYVYPIGGSRGEGSSPCKSP